MRKFNHAVLIVILSAAASGCTWVSSSEISPNSPGYGQVYYLPTQSVKAVYTRKKTESIEKAAAKLVAAKKTMDEVKAKLGAASAEKSTRDQQLASLDRSGMLATDKEYKEVLIKRGKAVGDIFLLNSAKNKAQTALNKALESFNDSQSAKGSAYCLEKITITPLPPVAEIGQRFQLQTRHSPLRSETAELTTTASGLLTTLDAEAVDQLDSIIVSLAGAVGGYSGLTTQSQVLKGFLRHAQQGSQQTKPPCSVAQVSHVLNPVVKSEWDRFTMRVNLTANKDYEIKPDFGSPTSAGQPLLGATPTSITGASRSIAYRRKLPLALEIYSTKKGVGSKQLDAVIQIEVPNHSPTEYLPINVGVFGATELNASFKNGMLIDAEQTRESEINKVAKIPFEALKAVTGGISQVLQLRIDQTGQQTELTNSEIALIEANRALLDAQEAAQEALESD